MSDAGVLWVVWGVVLLLPALAFGPTRKLLGFGAGQGYKFVLWIAAIAFGFLQGALARVWRAHLIVLRNLAPRGAVLPTVAQKTVRRE